MFSELPTAAVRPTDKNEMSSKPPPPSHETKHVPIHVIVVEDAPHVHKALLDGCGVRMYSMGRAEDEEQLLRPGVSAFDVELRWTDLRSLTERLRELLRLAPDALFAARPADIVKRCEERGVPVHTIPSEQRTGHSVRVLIFDATGADERPSDSPALRGTKSEVRLRVPSPSDPAPLRKLG
jgi:hypothetical protein